MTKPLNQMTPTEVSKIAALPVIDRCSHIIDELDEWLAVHVLRFELKHEDLPQLNDMFRSYFMGTRTVQASGSAASKKTMLVERDRMHYARAYGDSTHVRVDEPRAVELELPASYARDLLAACQRALAAGGEFEQAMLAVDLPVRLYLRPAEVAKLVVKLAEIK